MNGHVCVNLYNHLIRHLNMLRHKNAEASAKVEDRSFVPTTDFHFN